MQAAADGDLAVDGTAFRLVGCAQGLTMRTIAIATAVLITSLAASVLIAAADSQEAVLTVRFTDIEVRKGTLRVALCQNRKEFDDRSPTGPVFSRKTLKIDKIKGPIELVFDRVPHGLYAVRCYLDENENGKIDTGAFGIPTEPYGISGTAIMLNYVKALFKVDRAQQLVRIEMK
jgi:uncharacterized protein (DUF2141 family)